MQTDRQKDTRSDTNMLIAILFTPIWRQSNYCVILRFTMLRYVKLFRVQSSFLANYCC